MLVRNPNTEQEAPSWAGCWQIPLLCIASDSSPVPKDPEPGPQAARGSQPKGSPPQLPGDLLALGRHQGVGKRRGRGDNAPRNGRGDLFCYKVTEDNLRVSRPDLLKYTEELAVAASFP